MEPRTLAELTGQNVEIAFADAVAIAQQLICDPDVGRDAQPPYAPLTLESVAVTKEGAVCCLHTASTPTVTEVGLVMQSLLRNSPSLPGGLRYTVSRAIHEVEAPPFESVEDLSKALERFEAGDRREQIASLYQRAGAQSESKANLVSSTASEAGTPDYPERRTRQQSAASLRRQLREADQRFYEAQLHASQAHGPAEKGRSRRVPIAACMVAGVALVAAGEMAHVGQPARAMDAGQPIPPPSVVATTASPDTLSEPVVATVPVNASEQSPGPAASRKGTLRTNTRASASTTGRTATTTTTTTKPAPSRASHALTQSSRKAVETRPKDEHSKPKSKPDKSDHGLLRIRFVWDNPFH